MRSNAILTLVRGVMFPSQKSAAEALGVTASAINRSLTVHGHADRVGLGLAGGQIGNKNAARALTLYGLTFPSRVAAAKELGVTRSQITKWISPSASDVQRHMLIAAVMRYKRKRELESSAQAGDGYCGGEE